MANSKILDESLIGKALSYAYREFKALTLIFDDGYFKADNNAAKRAMRPCKLGMNNYLFFGNHESARRGAIIYTIIESCKLNGINVLEYLTDVFVENLNQEKRTICFSRIGGIDRRLYPIIRSLGYITIRELNFIR